MTNVGLSKAERNRTKQAGHYPRTGAWCSIHKAHETKPTGVKRVTGFDDIEYASLTDVGVKRSHNQDAYASMPASDQDQWRGRGHLFVVADGMGAHAVGELASKLAADSIPHVFAKHAHEGPVAALRKAFIEANLSIHTRGQQNQEFQGMGTTATAILLRPEGAWVGHVGDSRAYRVRNGLIEQLSFDHSLVWELARRQHKDPEELEGIPSNVIVRSLGPEPLVQVDVEGPFPIRAGDSFVLCSDGLSGPVTDREIGAVVSALPPTEACRFLIHLANLQGGPDNITAVVVQLSEGDAGASSDAAETLVLPAEGPGGGAATADSNCSASCTVTLPCDSISSTWRRSSVIIVSSLVFELVQRLRDRQFAA